MLALYGAYNAYVHRPFDVAGGVSYFIEVILIVSLLVAIPIAMLVPRRDAHATATESLRQIESVEQSLKVVRSRTDDLSDAITGQRTVMDNALDAMHTQLLSERSRLKHAESQIAKARSEADHYKRLAALSADDQKAFIDLLERSRTRDYIIGIVLGVLSSIIFAVLSWAATLIWK